MGERRQINLLYSVDPNWTGGSIYVLNIIRALNYLHDDEKPVLIVYYPINSSTKDLLKLGYPYLKTVGYKSPKILRAIFRVLRFIGFDFRIRVSKHLLENLYPINARFDITNITNPIYWIADFQDLYYPDFFGKQELLARQLSYKYIVKSKKKIVFSSYNALQDFEKFYPESENKKLVLRFVSIMDFSFLKALPREKLLTQYSIERPYYIVSNQFWIHKNHWIVLNAIKIAMNINPELLIVFTGKEYDYRYPKHTEALKKFVEEENLGANVKFLGFIERDDQLALMSYSIAVIQPSLFEGWSTVVEDSKTLNKHVILSDIPLHKEQIETNVTFFDPHSAEELADIMISHEKMHQDTSSIEELKTKLDQRTYKFGKEVLSILS